MLSVGNCTRLDGSYRNIIILTTIIILIIIIAISLVPEALTRARAMLKVEKSGLSRSRLVVASS